MAEEIKTEQTGATADVPVRTQTSAEAGWKQTAAAGREGVSGVAETGVESGVGEGAEADTAVKQPSVPAEIAGNGAFVRQPNRFSASFGEAPGELPVEAGRYRLLWCAACPWARTPDGANTPDGW